MRKSTVKRRIIRRRRMDPHTARPTNSSATKKTNGQHAIAQAFPFCHALVHPGLTCVMHAACYLAFLHPVLGNNRICEFQESLQWAFMLTARDCQWERFLPTLILEKHLHREVTENKTQLCVWRFFLQLKSSLPKNTACIPFPLFCWEFSS